MLSCGIRGIILLKLCYLFISCFLFIQYNIPKKESLKKEEVFSALT